LGDRGRAIEDEYFRRKDRELIERLREASAAAQVREDLGRKAGLADPKLVEELQELGFTPETVNLLPLVPVIQIAWAEGGVTIAEREMIHGLARSRGIEPGSAADRQLTEWLTNRPAAAVFDSAGRLIRAMLDSGPLEMGQISADDLVKHCEDIAGASGGILGIGRISGEERRLLSKIAEDLNARHT
jgi:hypothetical protein